MADAAFDPAPPLANAAFALAISKVDVDQGIKEPNAVFTNRQGKKTADTCLIGCACTLQSTLKADGGFDDVFKADAHHTTKVFCGVCVLSSSRQKRSVGERECSSSWMCSRRSHSTITRRLCHMKQQTTRTE